jgi:hypothetical protein
MREDGSKGTGRTLDVSAEFDDGRVFDDFLQSSVLLVT